MQLKSLKSTQNVLVLLILTTFLISGCSTVQKLDVFSTEVERVPLNLKSPVTPEMEEIKWVIHLHIYDAVGHGFWLRVDEDPAVRLAPATDAWSRLMAYLDRTLGA